MAAAAPAAAAPADAAPSALDRELSEIVDGTAKLEAKAAALRATMQKDYAQVDDLVKVRAGTVEAGSACVVCGRACVGSVGRHRCLTRPQEIIRQKKQLKEWKVRARSSLRRRISCGLGRRLSSELLTSYRSRRHSSRPRALPLGHRTCATSSPSFLSLYSTSPLSHSEMVPPCN